MARDPGDRGEVGGGDRGEVGGGDRGEDRGGGDGGVASGVTVPGTVNGIDETGCSALIPCKIGENHALWCLVLINI